MTWGKLIAGFLLGLSSASLYYNKERKSNINTAIECEKAWQKYRSMQNTFDVSKNIDITSISKELKRYGFNLDGKQTETIVNETVNHGVDSIPVIGVLIKKIVKSDQSAKWYEKEVIPKCTKIR